MMALLTIALFALADRFSGGPWIRRWGWRGRPIYYAGSLVIIAGILGGFVVPACAWVLWRLPGWKPGKMDPRTGRELALTLARHCIALLGLPGAWPLLAFPFIATGLAYWLARQADKNRGVNDKVELLRGAAFGLLVAL